MTQANMTNEDDYLTLPALAEDAYKVVFYGNGHNEGDPGKTTITGKQFRTLLAHLHTPETQTGAPSLDQIAETMFDARLWKEAWKRANEVEKTAERHVAAAVLAHLRAGQTPPAKVSGLRDKVRQSLQVITSSAGNMADESMSDAARCETAKTIGRHVEKIDAVLALTENRALQASKESSVNMRAALKQLADAKWTDDLTREIALKALSPTAMTDTAQENERG